MKSYGKPDASWNDTKFRGIIEDALGMAKENKKDIAVGQDAHGNVVVVEAKRDHPHICVCWVYMYKNKKLQDEPELGDHVGYATYSVEQMVPRVRNALTRGIMDFGGLRFLSEGRVHLGFVFGYAGKLIKLHGGPFIVGWTDKEVVKQSGKDGLVGLKTHASIVVAPVSERDYFVEHASCVTARRGAWSLPDRLSDTRAYQYETQRDLEATIVSDRRSIRLASPVDLIYMAILETNNPKHWE